MRETIFNVLGQRFDGERVLDLYAGSGAMAIEALSRGAGQAVLVERDREAAGICAANAAALGYGGRAQVERGDVVAVLGRIAGPFDLIFVDPPYAEGPAAALRLLDQRGLVAPGGSVVAEHDRREELPDAFGALRRIDLRRFGDIAVSFYESSPQESA